MSAYKTVFSAQLQRPSSRAQRRQVEGVSVSSLTHKYNIYFQSLNFKVSYQAAHFVARAFMPIILSDQPCPGSLCPYPLSDHSCPGSLCPYHLYVHFVARASICPYLLLPISWRGSLCPYPTGPFRVLPISWHCKGVFIHPMGHNPISHNFLFNSLSVVWPTWRVG